MVWCQLGCVPRDTDSVGEQKAVSRNGLREGMREDLAVQWRCLNLGEVCRLVLPDG